MSFKRQKRTLKARLPARLFLLTLLIIGIFTANGTWHAYQGSRAAEDKKNTESSELATLKARDSELSADLDALKTDRGIEAAIREKFGMVKNGEEVVVLPQEGNGQDKTGRSESFWQKIKDWLNL